MNKTPSFRSISLLLTAAATALAGCAVQRPLETRFNPCHRVSIDTPPIWTASAAWTPDQDGVLLVGPQRHSLMVYNLEGQLEREIELDALAEFEYASPVRLESTDDGYLIGDKNKILWLDRTFRKRNVWKPFEHLKKAGVAAGNISDFAVLGRTVYAFADFLWDDEARPEPKRKPAAEVDPSVHVVPGTDTPPEGNWFRGFVKISLENPELVTLHHFEIEDKEFTQYYLYGQRPYVVDSDKHAYVLRYTDPPQVFRASRRPSSKTFKPFYAGSADDDFKTTSLIAFEDRLYLLGWRRVDSENNVVSNNEPTTPQLIQGAPSRAELAAMVKKSEETRQRLLVEIDPKTGQALRRYRLPVENGSVKLVPGKSFWAMIEESSAVNLRPEDKVHLTLLPSSWLQGSRTASGSPEVVLECPAS